MKTYQSYILFIIRFMTPSCLHLSFMLIMIQMSSSQDLPYISLYGYMVSLDMVISNQPTSPDPCYISFQFERNFGREIAGPDQTLTVSSLAVTLSQGLYSTMLDKARLAVEVLFIFMTIFYLLSDLNTCFLAYQQFGKSFSGIQKYVH